MNFDEKLKDVELQPYMLSIYKDDENYTLLNHAIECWKIRINHSPSVINYTMNVGKLYINPIIYCAYPPLDLVKLYYTDYKAFDLLESRSIQCPKVVTWAFLESYEHVVMLMRNGILNYGSSTTLRRIFDLIEFDDDMIFRTAIDGLTQYFPSSFSEKLTPEQKAVVTICA